MPPRSDQIDAPLGRLDRLLGEIAAPTSLNGVIARWRSDAAALRFHLQPRDPAKPAIVAIIGGTGTGKSTLMNRLLGVDVTATNFRRTFTTGSVAVAKEPADIPRGWQGIPHEVVDADRLPARGQGGTLVVVPKSAIREAIPDDALFGKLVLVDTPDLDGDQPLHHAEAERAFRWAQGLAFLVSPEKYQMTELLPYYRLTSRYGIPTLFVMNKCEEQVVVEDYRSQLRSAGFGPHTSGITGRGDGEGDGPPVYTVPRDDAAYEPPPGENLAALRRAIVGLAKTPPPMEGLQNRAADLIGRFQDQITAPLRAERGEADRLVASLREMETPVPGVDVNPVTQDLERRLQQRSVLYLIGPQRMLDRVRQAPAMLVRLPRFAWDFMMRGRSGASLGSLDSEKAGEPPDFKAVLVDQFSVLQSRIADLLQTSAIAGQWIAANPAAYNEARVTPEEAGKIAEEELADLRNWLEKRWNATPRDTKMVESLLKFLPGAGKSTKMAEAAPYLLIVGLIAAHAAFFHVDLLVLGGYTAATWITERLANEVANRTRSTNTKISERFTKLAHEQILKMCAWIQSQTIAAKSIDQLDRLANEFARAAGIS